MLYKWGGTQAPTDKKPEDEIHFVLQQIQLFNAEDACAQKPSLWNNNTAVQHRKKEKKKPQPKKVKKKKKGQGQNLLPNAAIESGY